MKFAELQIFVDVVENGGMTQAAAISGVSQPGISRTIRDLETRMRATLLRRTGRGVELTPAGMEFLEFAKSSISALEEAKSRVLEVSGGLPDRLRIAIPPRLGSTVFPVLYRRFMQELPEVAVTATEAFTADMADSMNAGRLDLLVSYLPVIPGSGEGKPAFRESLYLVVGDDSADDEETEITLADLAEQPFLLNHQGSPYRRLIESHFLAAGHKLIVDREIETAEGLLAFACEGEGVTILPYSNFHAEEARGDVVGRLITNPQIERTIYIHIGRHLDMRTSDLVSRLIHLCLRSIADDVKWTPISSRNATNGV
ncbi:MAG: LysR family transcriptional regulator [Pseudomonadota bacterium]